MRTKQIKFTGHIPEACYILDNVAMADPSVKLVTPRIVKRGELGYWQTDWVWNKEHAKELLNEKNSGLGVSPEMASKMEGWSMFGWPKQESEAV